MNENPISDDLVTCTKCCVAKNPESFGKDKNSKSGLKSRCRQCNTNDKREYYKRNQARGAISIPDSKECFECNVKKSCQEFGKSNSNKDGLQARCKQCDSAANRLTHKNNKSRATVTIPVTKTCFGCKLEKSGLGFNKNKSRPDGLNSYCKQCLSASRMMSKYGVSEEWYLTTLAAQDGACSICGVIPGAKDNRLCIDHNHVTGKVRGLLCHNCNSALGFFKDRTDLLKGGEMYLQGPALEIRFRPRLPKRIKDAILLEQNSECKICNTDLSATKSNVDHCHKTGMIRGYLCYGCNCGLGQLKDSIELLGKSTAYLHKHEVS